MNMSKKLKKLHLQGEQHIVDELSSQCTELMVQGFIKAISKVIPINSQEELGKSLNKDSLLHLFQLLFHLFHHSNYSLHPSQVWILLRTAIRAFYNRYSHKL